MATFLALYHGRTVSQAKPYYVSDDRDLVALFMGKVLESRMGVVATEEPKATQSAPEAAKKPLSINGGVTS